MTNYFLQRNVSERYATKKPLKEMARTLLAEKAFCGGGVLQVYDDNMTEEQINKIGKNYAMNASKYELSNKMKSYITQGNNKYIVNQQSLVINRDVACSKTTREGCTRADSSDYICDELKDNYQCKMNEDLQGYAIRKLTPLECFRLMGVKDEDFDKVAQHQSNSSLYHLAGDSLLTTVMGAIFCNMIETPISFQEMVNSLYKSSTKGGLENGNKK